MSPTNRARNGTLFLSASSRNQSTHRGSTSGSKRYAIVRARKPRRPSLPICDTQFAASVPLSPAPEPEQRQALDPLRLRDRQVLADIAAGRVADEMGRRQGEMIHQLD